MKNPETYSELIKWFNCQKLKTYYKISNKNLEKIYYLLKRGMCVKGDKKTLTIYDPSGEKEEIKIKIKAYNTIAKGVEINSNSFKVIFPVGYYLSSLDGSASNNN